MGKLVRLGTAHALLQTSAAATGFSLIHVVAHRTLRNAQAVEAAVQAVKNLQRGRMAFYRCGGNRGLLGHSLQVAALLVTSSPVLIDQALGNGGQQRTRITDRHNVGCSEHLQEGVGRDVFGGLHAVHPTANAKTQPAVVLGKKLAYIVAMRRIGTGHRTSPALSRVPDGRCVGTQAGDVGQARSGRRASDDFHASDFIAFVAGKVVERDAVDGRKVALARLDPGEAVAMATGEHGIGEEPPFSLERRQGVTEQVHAGVRVPGINKAVAAAERLKGLARIVRARDQQAAMGAFVTQLRRQPQRHELRLQPRSLRIQSLDPEDSGYLLQPLVLRLLNALRGHVHQEFGKARLHVLVSASDVGMLRTVDRIEAVATKEFSVTGHQKTATARQPLLTPRQRRHAAEKQVMHCGHRAVTLDERERQDQEEAMGGPHEPRLTLASQQPPGFADEQAAQGQRHAEHQTPRRGLVEPAED
nr:hypothetical protein [Tanacetum cinerariifolium]